MFICSVCQKENDQFAITCNECGSYLQNKIANLDLFSTIWQLIEHPKNAFRIITLSKNKNYAFFLYLLTGVFISFTTTWYYEQGDKFDNLLILIIFLSIGGFILGGILSVVVPTIHWILTRIFKGKNTFRNSLAVTSYSFFPTLIALIVILPIQLMTFGMYLFTFNPHPIKIKPELYFIFILIDSLFILWSIILLIIGTEVSTQIKLWKAILIIFILLSILITCIKIIADNLNI